VVKSPGIDYLWNVRSVSRDADRLRVVTGSLGAGSARPRLHIMSSPTSVADVITSSCMHHVHLSHYLLLGRISVSTATAAYEEEVY